MNFFDLMNRYRCNKTAAYTHVSMLPHGGLYKIPDEELEKFYEEYNESIRSGAKFGILERPKDIGPMLVDVDIVKPAELMTPPTPKAKAPKPPPSPKPVKLTKLGKPRKPRAKQVKPPPPPPPPLPIKPERQYTRDRVIEYATAFQKQLLEHTDITDPLKLECFVLEKKPYLDAKGNCKNGFHLHFPTVWMTRKHRA